MSDESSVFDDMVAFKKELPNNLKFTNTRKDGFSSIEIINVKPLTAKFRSNQILNFSYYGDSSTIIKKKNTNNLSLYDLSFFDLESLQGRKALYILLFILNCKEGVQFIRNAGGEVILVPDTDADARNENYALINNFDPNGFKLTNLLMEKRENYILVSLKARDRDQILSTMPVASNQQEDPEVSTPTYKIR